MDNSWSTNVGEILTRQKLKELYGGSTYGGIEPSRTTPNVLVFTDPVKAEQNGYIYDGALPDGSMLYTGEGRRGDQLLREGNKAIAEHVAQNRSLRVFAAAGKVPGTGTKRHRYLGEYQLDRSVPFTIQRSPTATARPARYMSSNSGQSAMQSLTDKRARRDLQLQQRKP